MINEEVVIVMVDEVVEWGVFYLIIVLFLSKLESESGWLWKWYFFCLVGLVFIVKKILGCFDFFIVVFN